MKLKEYLETLPGDQAVRIGAAALYFYCGEAGKAPGFLADMDRFYIEQSLKTYENAKEKYRLKVRIGEEAYPPEPPKEHSPLEEREVKETYDSTLGEDLIIIVEGGEKGVAWDRAEYLDWLGNHEAAKALKEESRLKDIHPDGARRLVRKIEAETVMEYAARYEALHPPKGAKRLSGEDEEEAHAALNQTTRVMKSQYFNMISESGGEYYISRARRAVLEKNGYRERDICESCKREFEILWDTYDGYLVTCPKCGAKTHLGKAFERDTGLDLRAVKEELWKS